jgi:flagellar protein FliS
MSANPYSAYSRASHTTSKTRQVVMLYDGAIRFLQQAADAMAASEPPLRFIKLSRAAEIIGSLQSSLDLHHPAPQAQQLYDFYGHIYREIMALHRSNSIDQCTAVIAELRSMRDVWDSIDRESME